MRIIFKVRKLGKIITINPNNASQEEVDLLIRKFNKVKFFVSESTHNVKIIEIVLHEY